MMPTDPQLLFSSSRRRVCCFVPRRTRRCIEKVSALNETREGTPLSPLHADMADQGNKARASAARLNDKGLAPAAGTSVDVSELDVGQSGSENGIMPLRCSVNGRRVPVRTAQSRQRSALLLKVVFSGETHCAANRK